MLFNPGKKEFSFFSNVLHSFTQIDFFLVDNILLMSTSMCKYEPIVVSDHAATSVNIHFQKFNNSGPSWRLDTQLLLDKDFVRFVAEHLVFYF